MYNDKTPLFYTYHSFYLLFFHYFSVLNTILSLQKCIEIHNISKNAES